MTVRLAGKRSEYRAVGHGKRLSQVHIHRQVSEELRKVVWPPREQLLVYVYSVIIFVVAIMLMVYCLDSAFVEIVSSVFT